MLPRGRRQKGFCPLKRQLRVLELRLKLIGRRLLGFDVCLIGRLFNDVEKFPFFDFRSFLKGALLQKACHPREQIDPLFGLDAPEKPVRFRFFSAFTTPTAGGAAD